jgi:hypothetical protein
VTILHILKQWLSIHSSFALKEHLAMSGHILGCLNWREFLACSRLSPRMLLNILQQKESIVVRLGKTGLK